MKSINVFPFVCSMMVAVSIALVPTPSVAQDSRAVLINAFEVPAGAEEATQRWWESARDFLTTQPGYINTRLHRNLDAKGRFTFVNVAEWQSPAAFQAANQALAARLVDNKPPAGVTWTPGLFRVVAQ
jgi:heme oxygenase (mycobilin-producing)